MPPRIRAGELRHRIRIEGQTEGSPSETGEVLTTWSELVTLWAKFHPVSGREYFTAKQTASENSVMITTRWPRLIRVTTAHRVVELPASNPTDEETDRIFDIEAVINVDERDEEMLLVCVEHST